MSTVVHIWQMGNGLHQGVNNVLNKRRGVRSVVLMGTVRFGGQFLFGVICSIARTASVSPASALIRAPISEAVFRMTG